MKISSSILAAVTLCSTVLFSGAASAQTASPSPTPIPKQCTDRNLNRQVYLADRAAVLCERDQDKVANTQLRKDEAILRIDNQIQDVKDGRSTLSRLGCTLISFISKCDTSKIIDRLKNRKTRLQKSWDLRIALVNARSVRTCNAAQKKATDLTALKAFCKVS